MSLFLITFLAIYGATHAYAFYRLNSTFLPSSAAAKRLASLMVLMTIAPVLIRLAELYGLERTAMFLAWPGYIWMGALFLFCSALALLDITRLAAWVFSRITGSGFPHLLNARLTGKLALILSLAATVYSFFEARNIHTEHLNVATSKHTASGKRIRIVQISDVHLGLLVHEDRLQRILQVVKDARPDIIVSTGDLVDGRLNRQGALDTHGDLSKMLAGIPAPSGKYAVTGNHEFYAGIDQALDFTNRAGFKVLRDESIRVGTSLSFTGVDDPAGTGKGQETGSTIETTLLRTAEPSRFKILLKHRPIIEKASDGLFDLQLSGHSHKGQMFPFTLLVRLRYPLIGGTTRTAAGSMIHVSRGSGTWGPPLRFLAPPEVTIIDIVPAK
jgi:uncharacterized protein